MKQHSTTCYAATMLTALTALVLLTACGSETTAPTELGYMTARAQAEERNVAAAVLIGPRWQIACYGAHALSNCSVLRGAFDMKTMDVYNLEQADNADDFRTDVTVRIRD